jgi:hypothetical protein
MNLIEGLQSEINRVKEVKTIYESIGVSGQLALVITINPAIKNGEAALVSDDQVKMLTALQELKDIEV